MREKRNSTALFSIRLFQVVFFSRLGLQPVQSVSYAEVPAGISRLALLAQTGLTTTHACSLSSKPGVSPAGVGKVKFPKHQRKEFYVRTCYPQILCNPQPAP